MSLDPKNLLDKELADLKRMAAHLAKSLDSCRDIVDDAPDSQFSEDRVEAFTSRFARTADLLVNKALRTLDLFELEPSGSLLDVLNRAEKRRIIASAHDLRLIKNIRNMISHDYSGADMAETLALCRQWTPILLQAIESLDHYVLAHYP